MLNLSLKKTLVAILYKAIKIHKQAINEIFNQKINIQESTVSTVINTAIITNTETAITATTTTITKTIINSSIFKANNNNRKCRNRDSLIMEVFKTKLKSSVRVLTLSSYQMDLKILAKLLGNERPQSPLKGLIHDKVKSQHKIYRRQSWGRICINRKEWDLVKANNPITAITYK